MKHSILLITFLSILCFQCKNSEKTDAKVFENTTEDIADSPDKAISDSSLKFCTEIISKTEQKAIDNYLNEIKKRNNEKNIDEQVQGAILMPFKWQKKVLKVSFLEGSEKLKKRVKETAKIWETKCNIILNFGNHTHPDITISFKKGGSWSYIGNSSAKSSPSMNYGWLNENTPQQEYNRVVLHEFGHALGFIHEHNHPKSGIPWNRDKVYQYYAKMGWNKKMVDRNLFKKYVTDILNFTKFDKKSIMLYAIPNELTHGNFSVGWNTNISELDTKLAKIVY